MNRVVAAPLALALALALAPRLGSAQPGAVDVGTAADRTAAAAAAADAGDWATVEALATRVVDDPAAARGDRAEAYRLLGLAAFARRDPTAADAHFLAYLRLDLDGRLDPALYPPEVVAFLEDVRGRHAAELRRLRPGPRRSWLLNLLPPAGQFQNGHRAKAWTLTVVGGAALVANVGSYVLLRSWCEDDGTCAHTSSARTLREINLGAAVALAGLYVYGVWDGFRHFRQTASVSVTPVATIDGAGIVVQLRY